MIKVDGLTKLFRTKSDIVKAVDAVEFEAAAGEMVTLLGPSGCGKTTTLRCVAGLERPDGGVIRIGDTAVVDHAAGKFTPPHLRSIGMVFQSYAIWPHMTVYENVAYALEGKRLSREEARRRTMAALELVKLDKLADRPAPRLSGGQQQRVAIARAVVGEPRALLFDEPLSNLDAKLRNDMRTEIRRLQQHLGITALYVTHDQSEALAISDWIIVMRGGRIVERGRPSDIYLNPKTLFTAHFIGHTNLIPGRVMDADHASKSVRLDTLFGPLTALDQGSVLKPGDAARLSIRPEDLKALPLTQAPTANEISGRVSVATFQGPVIEAQLENGKQIIQCHLTRDTSVRPGDQVRLAFATNDAVALPDERLDDEEEVEELPAAK